MTVRTGLFAGACPFALARGWLAEAEKTEINDPNAMALSTVDAQGMPNARVVLLKAIEDDGFVFYTNYNSAKGQEVEQAQKAAFVIHWKSLRRQIRVRGKSLGIIKQHRTHISNPGAFKAAWALGPHNNQNLWRHASR